MGVAHVDYDALEREYVRGKMSIRALCKAHGIKGYSSVAEKARRDDWYGKRDALAGKVSEKTVEKVAERIAAEEVDMLMTVREEMLTVVRAAIYKFAKDLESPEYHVATKDLIELMKQGLLLIGEPTERTEEKSLAFTGNLADLPIDLVRELATAAREARTLRDGPRAAGLAVPALPPRTRSN